MLIEGAEGPAVQGRCGGAEAAGANRIRCVVQEKRGVGRAGARGGKVAAVQLGGDEIDQEQYALSAGGGVELVEGCGERVTGAAVLASA